MPTLKMQSSSGDAYSQQLNIIFYMVYKLHINIFKRITEHSLPEMEIVVGSVHDLYCRYSYPEEYPIRQIL